MRTQSGRSFPVEVGGVKRPGWGETGVQAAEYLIEVGNTAADLCADVTQPEGRSSDGAGERGGLTGWQEAAPKRGGSRCLAPGQGPQCSLGGGPMREGQGLCAVKQASASQTGRPCTHAQGSCLGEETSDLRGYGFRDDQQSEEGTRGRPVGWAREDPLPVLPLPAPPALPQTRRAQPSPLSLCGRNSAQ